MTYNWYKYENTMSYLAWLIGGVISIGFGIVILIEGGFSYFGVRSPGRVVAIAPLILGILCFRMVPKAIEYEKREDKHGKYLKCPKCGKMYEYRENQVLKCADCQVDLENLKGFFDRHPELK